MSLRLIRLAVLLSVIAATTGGCGLKGDLYLPEAGVATTTDEEDENKDKSQQSPATDSDATVTDP